MIRNYNNIFSMLSQEADTLQQGCRPFELQGPKYRWIGSMQENARPARCQGLPRLIINENW